MLDVDPLTGTPRSLLKLDGALSGSDGRARDTVAPSYLRANAGALGLTGADVSALDLAKRVDRRAA